MMWEWVNLEIVTSIYALDKSNMEKKAERAEQN